MTKRLQSCDNCVTKKVRCDDFRPCSRCRDCNLDCTNFRVRRKRGPKSDLKVLTTYVEKYNNDYYFLWPIVDTKSMLPIESSRSDFTSTANYILALAITASISRFEDSLDHKKMIKHAESLKITSELQSHPSLTTILISIFLYQYHYNTPAAIVHLREAISIAQILQLHRESSYNMPNSHQMRKIYYFLFINERFMGLKDKVPVILDSNIKYPDFSLEADPESTHDFMNEIQLYSVIPKELYNNIIEGVNCGFDMSMLDKFYYDGSHNTPILSKQWLRCILWNYGFKFGYPVDPSYPVTMGNEIYLLNLPKHPDALVKVLEFSHGLINALTLTVSSDSTTVYNTLHNIFNKIKAIFPAKVMVYNEIERIIVDRLGETLMNSNYEPSTLEVDPLHPQNRLFTPQADHFEPARFNFDHPFDLVYWDPKSLGI